MDGTYWLHYLSIDFFRFLAIHYSEPPLALVFIGAQLLGVVVAIAVASVSWRWFEKPWVRRGHAYDY
jgi:peptidoglycan/LPS O-acetylase OafA/YrhL